MNHWEDIRSNWVNGNRTDAKNMLYQQSKIGMLKAIREAVENHFNYWNESNKTHSGDLQDLREILRAFQI